jgi:hypothetical protein
MVRAIEKVEDFGPEVEFEIATEPNKARDDKEHERGRCESFRRTACFTSKLTPSRRGYILRACKTYTHPGAHAACSGAAPRLRRISYSSVPVDTGGFDVCSGRAALPKLRRE